ncbi:MAG: hypothetical protein ACRES6_02480 [Steroidobacteraceae bacterium]
MERESLLAVLIILLGGLALQPFASWPWRGARGASPAELERRSWLRLWYPLVPVLLVAAWLCGWALSEPDPVPDVPGRWMFVLACVPFALLSGRALARSAWALMRTPLDCGVSTVGLIQPQVVFSPFLAKQLDDGVIRAALAHERAHAAHRDPLRIWVGQLVTDLQWPWPGAQRRFDAWLDALELARDDEARTHGADGGELAAAVLASVRYLTRIEPRAALLSSGTQLAHARLVGDSRALRERVSRLLAPLKEACSGPSRIPTSRRAEILLSFSLLAVLALGVIFGERVMHPLLALMF